MCLLALYYRMVDDASVVVGANREEAYARGGEPPRVIDGPIRMVAGIDPAAGGTWLGVNAAGLLVAVTNRGRSEVPARPRSRGLLTRDLLGCRSVLEAVDLAARELGTNNYAGCNFLLADQERAYVVMAGDWLRIQPLSPSLYLLTARDLNDVSDTRLQYARGWLADRRCTTSAQCLAALRELCADPGNGGPPMCLRGREGGTVSSTLILLRRSLARSGLWHCQGPPDRNEYVDYSHLLRELDAKPSKPDA
jgi:uncharacterized protein with NRDE domain